MSLWFYIVIYLCSLFSSSVALAQELGKVKSQLDSLNKIKEDLEIQIKEVNAAINAKSKEFQYLDIISRSEDSYKKLTANSDIVVRDQKSYRTGIDLFTIKKNETFVISKFEDGYYYKVEYEGKRGFVHITLLNDTEYDLKNFRGYWIERNKIESQGKNEESIQYEDSNLKNQGTSLQCSATTNNGSRCRRMTTSSNGKCYQHGGN